MSTCYGPMGQGRNLEEVAIKEHGQLAPCCGLLDDSCETFQRFDHCDLQVLVEVDEATFGEWIAKNAKAGL